MTKTVDDDTVDQFYIDANGDVFPEETWVNQDGASVLVKDLSHDEAKDIIRYLIRGLQQQANEYQQLVDALDVVFESQLNTVDNSPDNFDSIDKLDAKSTIH